MANYDFPEYVEERVRYFDGQFLQDQDFIDEQKYHIDRLRQHNRYLHATGIIEGLTVDAGTKLVTVANGTALDTNGRLIVLSKKSPAEVPTGSFTGPMMLIIQFKEQEARPTMEGSAGNSRFQTNPILSLVAVDNIPSDAVVLAALNIGADNNIDAADVDTSVRVYSGLNLPGRADGTGPRLRALSFDLAQFDGTLSVAGKLGIGTTTPGQAMSVIGTIRGAKAADETEYAELGHSGSYGFVNTKGDGNLNFCHDGQAKMSLTDAGNVGIGTDTPGQALSVIGAVRGAKAADETEYTELGHSGSHGYINTRGDGNLDFRHDGTTKMSLTDAGNVGIGTDAPSQRLHLKTTGGNGLQYALMVQNPNGADGGGSLTGLLMSVEPGNFGKAALVFERKASYARGSIHFLQENSANENIPTLSNAVMTIDKGGSVGIGISDPNKKLHVEGGEVRVRAKSNAATADIGAFYTNNLTQGIGIGYNRIEAIGSNTNQDIQILPKGTGNVEIGANAAIDNGATSKISYKNGSITLSEIGVYNTSKLFIANKQNGNIGFETNSSERVTIDNDGNVGIGTTGPTAKLEVLAKGDGARLLQLTTDRAWAFEQEGGGSAAALRLRNISGSNKNLYIDTNGSTKWRSGDGATTFMNVDHGNGRVGIGTDSPRARLHITGSGDTISAFTGDSNGGAWMSQTAGAGSDEIGWAWDAARDGDANRNLTDVSIYADGSIVADGTGVFVATTVTWSDARSKNIIGVSDGKKDLENLLRIKVTDYVKIREGNREKKVVAQELSKVFPQAVSMMQGVVPTIFQAPDDFSYNVDKKELTIKLGKAHEVVEGDEIDVYTDKEKLEKIEVQEVLSEDTFVIACDYEPDKVFVYGKWVDDVHMVDYDAIAMLNVSATQQLYRLTQRQKNAIDKISKQNIGLKKAIAELQEKMKNRKNGVFN